MIFTVLISSRYASLAFQRARILSRIPEAQRSFNSYFLVNFARILRSFSFCAIVGLADTLVIVARTNLCFRLKTLTIVSSRLRYRFILISTPWEPNIYCSSSSSVPASSSSVDSFKCSIRVILVRGSSIAILATEGRGRGEWRHGSGGGRECRRGCLDRCGFGDWGQGTLKGYSWRESWGKHEGRGGGAGIGQERG